MNFTAPRARSSPVNFTEFPRVRTPVNKPPLSVPGRRRSSRQRRRIIRSRRQQEAVTIRTARTGCLPRPRCTGRPRRRHHPTAARSHGFTVGLPGRAQIVRTPRSGVRRGLSANTLVRSEGREPRRPWTSARAATGEPRRRCLATSPWNHFGSLAPRGYQRQMSRHDLFRSLRARATTPSSTARAMTLDARLDFDLRFTPCVSPSAQRLAFSCKAPRERSDRGPCQLQRPSWTAMVSLQFVELRVLSILTLGVLGEADRRITDGTHQR